MWTEYKKEIIAMEKQGRKDFLKTFYHKNKLSNTEGGKKDLKQTSDDKKVEPIESPTSTLSSMKDPSLSIVYDSDEEPPFPSSMSTPKEKEKAQNKNVCIDQIYISNVTLNIFCLKTIPCELLDLHFDFRN